MPLNAIEAQSSHFVHAMSHGAQKVTDKEILREAGLILKEQFKLGN